MSSCSWSPADSSSRSPLLRLSSQHANEEQVRAGQIALGITRLRAPGNLDPQALATRSHAEYDDSTALLGLVRDCLIAERIAIECYSEIIQ